MIITDDDKYVGTKHFCITLQTIDLMTYVYVNERFRDLSVILAYSAHF